VVGGAVGKKKKKKGGGGCGGGGVWWVGGGWGGVGGWGGGGGGGDVGGGGGCFVFCFFLVCVFWVFFGLVLSVSFYFIFWFVRGFGHWGYFIGYFLVFFCGELAFFFWGVVGLFDY